MSTENTRDLAATADLSRKNESASETLTPEQEAKVKGGIGETKPDREKLATN